MCLSRRGIAACLVAAAALLAASASSYAIDIPSAINAPLTLPGGQTHRLVSDTTIAEAGTLVCEAGARVRAEPGRLLTVRGVLQAEGTRFFCPTGKWGGIEFRTTKSSQSKLEFCQIEDAGGAGERAAILCEGTRTIFPAPSLIGCRIIRSAGDGVRSIGGAPMLKNCTISDCAGIAVRNTLGGYVKFENPCTAIGNRSNTVTFDKTGHGVIFPQEWRPAGFYYRILGDVGTRARGRITIQAGVELRMGNGVSLIADRGPINAFGTAASPIVIRGIGNWSGQWGGIFIKRGGAPSTFQYCDIRNGGARTCCCGKASHLVAIGATRRGGLRVRNCKLRSGAGPGIYVEDAIATVTNSVVRDHADMGVVVRGTGQLTVSGSTIQANGRAGVYSDSSGAVVLTPNNSLLSNGQYEVVNESANGIPARRNNWGVSTARAIARRIYDGQDKPGLGIVDFRDFIAALAASGADMAAPAFAITSATAVPSNAGIVQITYALSAPGDVEAEVLNIAGRPIRRLAGQGEGVAGLNTLLWDRRSDTGLAVPTGRYIIRLRATSPDGEQAHATATAMVPAQ